MLRDEKFYYYLLTIIDMCDLIYGEIPWSDSRCNSVSGFRAAREKERHISCLSNEKQIGRAIIQYTQDYDDTYFGWDFANYLMWWSRRDTCMPYFISKRIWVCPSASSQNMSGSNNLISDFAINDAGGHFDGGYN